MANAEHTHHRYTDRIWDIQRNLLAVFLTVIAFGGSFALVRVWGQSIVDPYIERVACRMDSANHMPLQKEISEIRAIEKKTDTNIAIIKSILEVLATNDQLVIAAQRRNNPTGIR